VPGLSSVTPEPATVTCPAPSCRTSITVSIGNATEAFVGTVSTVADAEFMSITFPASARTRV
jgi:hypothetical protein